MISSERFILFQILFCSLHTFFILAFLFRLNYWKTQIKTKLRSNAGRTAHLDCSAHLFDQSFYNWHSQPRSSVLRSCIIYFLCKRLKQFFFYIFFAHPYTCIRNTKFECRTHPIKREFFYISVYPSSTLIIFDCITEQIQHNSSDLQRISDQRRMIHLFPMAFIADFHRFYLCTDHNFYLIYQRIQIKRIILQF